MRLILPWLVVFLASGPQACRAFAAGALWSGAIAAAIAWSLKTPNFAVLLGPRLVEGVLFFQYLPKQTSWQLPAAAIWAVVALFFDVFLQSGVAIPASRAVLATLLLHLLRFCTLVSIYHGLNYGRRVELLGKMSRRQARQRRGKFLWKLSWLPFLSGVHAFVRCMERAQVGAKGDGSRGETRAKGLARRIFHRVGGVARRFGSQLVFGAKSHCRGRS